MDLQPLFEMQKKLDERIVEEKGLQGQDLLDKKILALQVELGELANEWRGFKFWKDNPESRTEYTCELCEGRKEISVTTDTGSVGETYEVYDIYEVDAECPMCEGYDIEGNPMLEEYVDCLHFILSIGNDRPLNVNGLDLLHEDVVGHNTRVYTEETITKQLNCTFESVYAYRIADQQSEFEEILLRFIALGKMLGFTWQEIEDAYYDKNKVNHERQSNGY